MIKKNQVKLLLSLLIGILLIWCNVISAQPMPGLPYRFWGTAKDTQGNNLPDGTTVLAVVDGENYTTTVVNGIYGYYTPFYVEDPDNDNMGKTIYFFINGIDTTQTVIFDPGTANLNLTVDLGGDNDDDSSNGNDDPSQPPSNNDDDDTVKELIPPVADIGGPYYGFINKTVIFNASASYDPDGEIISYNWNFGDDGYGSNVTVSHVYHEYGVYDVSLLVTDNDDLIDTDETTIKIMYDSDDDGWGDEEEIEYDTDPYNSSDYPLDTDGDHTPDSVDLDDDNDGLADEIEEMLGSNSIDPTDVRMIQIENISHYLVDTDIDGIPDIFYNSINGTFTLTNITDDGMYLLDVDGDGNWDYVYDPATGSVLPFQEEDSMEVILLITILIVVIIFVIIIVTIIIIISRKRVEKKEK